MSKEESKPKVETKRKTPQLSKCPKCGKERYVTEPGMAGTKHCPDCGHWTGLKEWSAKVDALGKIPVKREDRS